MDVQCKSLSRSAAGALAAFTSQFLLFQLTESLVNDRAAALLGAEAVNAVYSAGLLATAGGYLLFALLARRVAAGRAEAAAGAAYLFSAVCMARAARPAAFAAFALAALLAAGYLGGRAHFLLALELRGSAYTGRAAGAAIAAGIGLQYLAQNLLPRPAALVLWIAAACCVVVVACRRPGGEPLAAAPASPRAPDAGLRGRLLVLTAAVVLMSLIVSLDDTICLTLHASGSVDLFAGLRLFYAGSILLAGFLTDRRGRACLPLVTVCAMLISGVALALLDRSETYAVNVGLLYVYSGFYVEFFTVTFLDAAPATERPELWAGMGRIARSCTLAAATVPFLRLFNAFGALPMTALSALFTAGCLVLFFAGGMLGPARAEQPPSSDRRALERFAQKHRLSPREAEVLAAIVDNDRSIRELAEKLHISERTAYRCITGIYEKTGASSRLGLSLIYYGKYKDEDAARQPSADESRDSGGDAPGPPD